MENGKNPIYPISGSLIDKCGTVDYNPFGLTKREYFAAMAMQGMITNPTILRPNIDNKEEHLEFSRVCLQYADSLLKQLDNN